MATVRIWNPQRKKKIPLSREEAEKRQAKAVQFLRDVADDPDMADEIEGLSVDEYAQRKGFDLTKNPTKKRKGVAMKKDELKQAVKDGVIEAFKETRRRSNPDAVQPTPAAPKRREKSDQEKILTRVDDAAAAIADDDPDEALDILNGVLEDYGDDD